MLRVLRYFYILICISLCFCYEYIEKNQQIDPKVKSEFRKKNEKRKIQFDVANFLRYSTTEKAEDYEPYAYKNKHRAVRTQSDYYYGSPLNENIMKRNENTNYFNIETDPDSNDNEPTDDEDSFQSNPQIIGKMKNKDKVSNQEKASKHNELLDDNDLILNPENKCAFKNMKVPFFSHKSTAKKQKRKFICFHCSKRYAKESLKPESNPKTKQLVSKLRRAYGNLCPQCIRNLLTKQKVPKKNRIHNSREYYQNIAQENIQNEKALNTKENTSKSRLKRDDIGDQDRRLKELDEVERKVDNVKVTTPKFIIKPKNDARVDGYSEGT